MMKTQLTQIPYLRVISCFLILTFLLAGCLWFKKTSIWVTVSWKPGTLKNKAEEVTVIIGADKGYYGYLEPNGSLAGLMDVTEPKWVDVYYILEGDPDRHTYTWSGCPVEPGKQRKVKLEIRPGYETKRDYMANVTCWVDGVQWVPPPPPPP